jgi:hypothetical protein
LTTPAEPVSIEGMQALEARAEAAYAAMYDARPSSVAKDFKDDACGLLYQAIRMAEALGLAEDAARLNARVAHIRAVWNCQFRF